MSRKKKSRLPPASGTPGGPRRRALVVLVIVAATLAAFLPTLDNQFVDWDDDENLVNNPDYRGLGWRQLRWMWTSFHMGHYIPLTWMSFGLDYLVWGMNPRGYHLTSLLLHAANAALFYLVARRLLARALPGHTDRDPPRLDLAAAFAALFFALHPLRVESVAWATERRDVLSGLFYLSTVLFYLRAQERDPRRQRWYWGAVALCACALLSKSMAVSLPVILLILDVYPLRRLGRSLGWWGPGARRVYVEKLPFAALAAAAVATAFVAIAHLGNLASLHQVNLPARLVISLHGLAFYLWKTLVPLSLSPLYSLPEALNPWTAPFLLSGAAVLAIATLVLLLRRRLPGLAAVSVAYVVILLPVLGFFQNGPQITADRYTYLANLGWALLAGGGLLACRRALPAAPAAWIGGAVVVGLGLLTWQQVPVWRNPETLWAHALSIEPHSPIPHYNFGNTLAHRGKMTEAIEHYRLALKFRPVYPEAQLNWGTALAHLGRFSEAIEHYRQALALKPDYAQAHDNWGLALANLGRAVEATLHYREALRIDPRYFEAHDNWGLALARQGRHAEAIEHYREALALKPDLASARNNWGQALVELGRTEEAIEHFRRALALKPDLAEAHNNWGRALAQLGRLAEAVEHFQRAATLRPDSAEAHFNLLNALVRQGKTREALEYWKRLDAAER